MEENKKKEKKEKKIKRPRSAPSTGSQRRNLCQKLFRSESHEHRILKSFFHFFIGILFAALIFVYVLYQRNVEFEWSGQDEDEAQFNESQSTLIQECGKNVSVAERNDNLKTLHLGYWITAAVIILLFGISFMISMELRSLTTLMLPSLFTTRGRVMLYSLLLTILLMGPVQQIKSNVQVVSESMSCSKGVLADRTHKLRTEIQEKVQDTKKNISIVTEQLLNSMMKFLRVQSLISLEWSLCLDRDTCNYIISQKDISDKYENKMNFTIDISKPNITFSKSLHEIKCNIYEKVDESWKMLTRLRVVEEFLSFTIIFLIFEAWWYKRNYRNKEHYDNHYITNDFKKLDKEKASKGERALGRLRFRERKRLTDATTVGMSWTELKVVAMWGLVWVLFVLMGSVLLIFDLGLYQVLQLIREKSNNTINLSGGVNVTAACQYDSKSKECSKNLTRVINSNAPFDIGNILSVNFSDEILTEECLPQANLPYIFKGSFILLVVVYSGILIITLLQAYGLRLRHTIAASFYPSRERERVHYLHTSMLMRRKSFARFMFSRRKIGIDHFDFFDWLEARNTIFMSFLRCCRLVRPKCDRCERRSRLKELGEKKYCYDCHDEVVRMSEKLSQDTSISTSISTYSSIPDKQAPANLASSLSSDGASENESNKSIEPEPQLGQKRSVKLHLPDSVTTDSTLSMPSEMNECCQAMKSIFYFLAGLTFSLILIVVFFYNQNIQFKISSLAPSEGPIKINMIEEKIKWLNEYKTIWGVAEERDVKKYGESLKCDHCTEITSKPHTSKNFTLENIPLHIWALASCFVILFSSSIAFSQGIRCVTCLLVPGIFSIRGRAILFSVLIQRLLLGPFHKMKSNTHKIAEAMACMSGQAVDKTWQLKDELIETLQNETRGFEGSVALFDIIFNYVRGRQKCDDNNFNATVGINVSNEIVKLGCNDLSRETRVKFGQEIDELRIDMNKKTVCDIKCDVNKQIHDVMGDFERKLSIVANIITPILILLLILEAIWYWWHYVHKEDHDNRYVTKRVRDLDEQRQTMGKKLRLLPLHKKERHHVIEIKSWVLSRVETKTLFVWLVFWFLFLIFGVILFIIDYGLAWVLNTLGEESDVNITVTSSFTMTPNYHNFSQTIKNWLHHSFQLGQPYNVNKTLKLETCLKPADAPFVGYKLHYNKPFFAVVGLYLATLGLTIFQAYGMRLQRTIAAYFYAKREEERSNFFIAKTLLERTSRIKTMVSAKYDRAADVVVGKDDLDEYQEFKSRWPQWLANFFENVGLLKRRCFFCGEEYHPKFFRIFPSATDEEYSSLPKKTICADCHMEFHDVNRDSIGGFLRDSHQPDHPNKLGVNDDDEYGDEYDEREVVAKL